MSEEHHSLALQVIQKNTTGFRSRFVTSVETENTKKVSRSHQYSRF